MDMDNNSNSHPNNSDNPKTDTSAEELLKKLKANLAANPPKKQPEIIKEKEAEKEPTIEIPKITEEKTPPAAEPTISDEEIEALMRKYLPERYSDDDTAGADVNEDGDDSTPHANESEESEESVENERIIEDEEEPESVASTRFNEDDLDLDTEPIDRYKGFAPKKKRNGKSSLKSSGRNNDIARKIQAAEAYATKLPEAEELPEEIIPRQEEPPSEPIDDVDLDLMLAFGMVDELEKTVGIEKIAERESDIDKNFEHISEKNIRKGDIAKSEFEFTSTSQAKDIFKGYKKVYHSVLIRLLACFLLLIMSFIYENIGMFGGTLFTPLNPESYPIIYILIDLQLLLLACALVYKSLYNGMVSLGKFQPIPESLTFIVAVLTVIYHVGLCFIDMTTKVMLFNFPVIMCIFMNLIYEFMNLKREIYSFNIASSKRTKYAVDKINTKNAELEKETFFEYLPPDPLMLKIKKVSFVENFYKRMNAYPKNKKLINVIIPIVLVVTVAFFIINYYLSKDLNKSLSMAYMTFVICTPFSLFLTYSYPFYKASKDAFEMDSTIIGEASLEEYSSASTISFDDKDVFPSYGVKVKSIKIFGNNRIDQVIYHASSLFNSIGGPLADVFDIATLEMGHTEKVDVIEVAEDGIEAMVDDNHILVGKASYILRNEFVPVNPDEDDDIEDGGEVSVMYVVFGNEVAAKMYIQYVIDPDFEFVLRQLYKAGMCIGIKTFDPNINNRMLSARVRLNKYPVKIIRCRSKEDQIETDDKVDSGIISKGSTKSLLQTLAMCDKVLHITKTNLVVKVFSMMISVIIMIFIMSLDMGQDVYSGYVALYQLFWSIPMLIIARLFI